MGVPVMWAGWVLALPRWPAAVVAGGLALGGLALGRVRGHRRPGGAEPAVRRRRRHRTGAEW